jgi:type VI protein secretion system component Hcp
MALEIYLHSDKIAGIHPILGDKVVAKTEKLIKLDSIQHGISRPVANIRPSTIGVPRSFQLEHGFLTAVRRFDVSSINLIKAHMEGIPLPLVHILCCRILKKKDEVRPQAVIHIAMTDVLIADYAYAIGESTSETIRLRYSSIVWQCRPVPGGASIEPTKDWIAATWDGVANSGKDDSPQSKAILDKMKSDQVGSSDKILAAAYKKD